MKNKEFIIMTCASLLLLGFVVYMLLYSFDMSKTNLIREDIKMDSVILKENMELKISDSIIKVENINLNSKIIIHESRIRNLENRKPLVRKDTVFLIN
jgi:hypothetical protein